MESALQASQRFTRSVLDGLGAHVCVIDDNGVIVTVNRAWLDFAAANGGSLSSLQEGANYLRVCEVAACASSADAAVAAQFLALLREVIAGHRQHFQLEYPCHSPAENRWFMVRVSRIEASEPPRYVVAHDNVTALKQAQEALRQQATTDELTGVANRRSFIFALQPGAVPDSQHRSSVAAGTAPWYSPVVRGREFVRRRRPGAQTALGREKLGS